MQKTNLHTLLTRFFGNDFPEDIRSRFATWFIQPEQMDEKEEVLEEIWNSLPVTTDFASFVELKKVNKRIRSKANLYYRRLAAIAAIIILPLLSILTTIWYHTQPEILSHEIIMMECFVPNGERKQLTLSDGTTVWLNSGSILFYPNTFGKIRTLYLSGEGYFTVAKDEEKPFIVKTSYIDVEALGTVFNVRSYPDEDITTTSLESGKVRVNDRAEIPESALLNPNEKLVYYHLNGLFEKSVVDASRISAWSHGYLIFHQETLQNIFRSLERQYNVKINYNDSKFAGMTFTVRFHPEETLEEALAILKQIGVDFKYKINDGDVYIQ